MVVRLSDSMPYAGLKSCEGVAVVKEALMVEAAGSSWEVDACGFSCAGLAARDKVVTHDDMAALNADMANMEDSPVLPPLARALEAFVEACEQQHRLEQLQGGTCATAPRATVFHGLRAPPISIEAYMLRIATYAKCSPVCFAQSFLYIKRLSQKDAGLRPTTLNVHRLLLTGVLLAAKFMDDRYYNNAFYAKVGGIATAELNRLELAMLKLLDYRLTVQPEELCALLQELAGGATCASMLLEQSSCMDCCAVVVAADAGAGVTAAANGGRLKRRSCSDDVDMQGDCRRQHRRSSYDAGHELQEMVA